MNEFDVAIIGGGVMGLSVAYELLNRNRTVCLVDRDCIGRSTSWAGAGMLPDSNLETAHHPLEKLTAFSHELHFDWARRLKSLTSIDNELSKCGTLHFARTEGESAAIDGMRSQWLAERIDHETIDTDRLLKIAPTMAQLVDSFEIRQAVLVTGDMQIRNPRHLAALKAACILQNATLLENRDIQLKFSGRCIESICLDNNQTISARQFCVTAGAWSGKVVEQLDLGLKFVPIRGQMLLYKLKQRRFKPTLMEGPRYVVSRNDGHLLVGSTVEDVGFDNSNTDEAIKNLTEFACDVVPELRDQNYEQCWAGLRPSTYDGFPYIGTLPGFNNGFLAAGHFRAGLHLSTGTAVAIGQLMCGEDPIVDLTPFRISRG